MRALVLVLALACGSVAASSSWLGNQDGLHLSAAPGALYYSDMLADGQEGSTRKLLGATSFIQVLQTGADGVKIIKGSVVATGYENDPFCNTEAYICVQTQPCRSARRRGLLQTTAAAATVMGKLSDKAVEQVYTGIILEVYKDVIDPTKPVVVTYNPETKEVTVAATTKPEFDSVPIQVETSINQQQVTLTCGNGGPCPQAVVEAAPTTIPATLASDPGNSVVLPSQRRRRSLLAAEPSTLVTESTSFVAAAGSQGNEFTYTTQLIFKGNDAGSQAGTNYLAGSFGTGGMDICAGYSFREGGSKPAPVTPIKPVQRYDVTVGVATRGASCADWQKRRGKRAYQQCAASLTGQPNAFVDSGCAVFGNPNRKRKNLTIFLRVRRTGNSVQAQSVLDSLMNDVNSGALATCLQAQGLARYKPLGVRSTSLDIPNPRLNG